jgi:hypothetical protein
MSSVADFRRAARTILRSDVANDVRCDALVLLMSRAKEHADADIIGRAIVTEIGFEQERAELERQAEVAADPVIRRHHELRRRGHDRCSRCLSRLSTPAEWEEWRRLDDQATHEIAVREGAIA